MATAPDPCPQFCPARYPIATARHPWQFCPAWRPIATASQHWLFSPAFVPMATAHSALLQVPALLPMYTEPSSVTPPEPAYANVFQSSFPLPILNLPVSVSKPGSPDARTTELLFDQLLAVSLRSCILLTICISPMLYLF